VVDPVRSKERLFQLNLSEFVYFLCRLTDAHYDNTDYEEEKFWLKLNTLLIVLLEPFELRPQFRFGAKFSIDSAS